MRLPCRMPLPGADCRRLQEQRSFRPECLCPVSFLAVDERQAITEIDDLRYVPGKIDILRHSMPADKDKIGGVRLQNFLNPAPYMPHIARETALLREIRLAREPVQLLPPPSRFTAAE